MRPAVGIIAEYNPFHLGHARQIAALREILGADCAVAAVMSGSFVQRGEPAVLSKYVRAEAAVRCGVNLVLELPAVYAVASAETFARGGVALLHGAGVFTHLCFGSEAGDLSPLMAAAACLDSEDYHQAVRRRLSEGVTFAAARQAAVREGIGAAAECLRLPNNNLAVEYLRALRRLGSTMEPLTIRRFGAAHDSDEDSGCPSASLIRRRMLAGEPWQAGVPAAMANLAEAEIAAGRGPASLRQGERAVLAVLRGMTAEDLLPYDGGGEGLCRRFHQAVRRGRTLEEVLALCKTKRYPLSRLRRMAIAAYLRLPPPAEPPYLRLLAADGIGCALLREIKRTSVLPVITKPAGVRRLGPQAQTLFAAEARCTALYDLCCPVLGTGTAGGEYAAGAIILNQE